MHSVSLMLVQMREMTRVRTCGTFCFHSLGRTYIKIQENDPATFNISSEVKLATLAQISDHKELPTLGSNEKKKGKF